MDSQRIARTDGDPKFVPVGHVHDRMSNEIIPVSFFVIASFFPSFVEQCKISSFVTNIPFSTSHIHIFALCTTQIRRDFKSRQRG